VIAVIAAAALAGCAGSPPTAQSQGGVRVIDVSERQPAPALKGELLGGDGTFELTAHAGEVVVLNFWASWCAPCVAEAPDLEQTYQATKASRVAFVGINVGDQRDPAEAFVRGRTTYPSVFDPASKLALGFSIPPSAIPSTIVIDRKGRVAVVVRRAILRSELEPVVNQLAAESL
jgi:thiol-disulfide isomerase/thioredoxin